MSEFQNIPVIKTGFKRVIQVIREHILLILGVSILVAWTLYVHQLGLKYGVRDFASAYRACYLGGGTTVIEGDQVIYPVCRHESR